MSVIGAKSQMNRPRRRFHLLLCVCLLSILLYLITLTNWDLRTIKDYGVSKFQDIKSIFSDPNEIYLRIEDLIGEKGYRIYTNSCKISDLPLYDQETISLFKNYSDVIWQCEPEKIKIDRFNGTSLGFNWSAVGYKPLCYYRELSRGKHDREFLYGEFSGPLENTTLSLPSYFFVHIVCYTNNIAANKRKLTKNNFNVTDTDIIHDEIIPLIPVVNKTSDSDVPNVLLLAIDATSFVNFKRHFIRTEKLLNKYKFYELRGYNKVGANTFPNMIPFLTGHHSPELVPDKELKNIWFDDWPIIWKKYSEKGFVTAFLEEMSWCGLFHFNLWGFEKKPVDYQVRPWHMEIMNKKYNYYCYLDKTEMEHSLDWTLDFVRAMHKREQKYFAYISIAEMTHDWIEAGHYMDVPYHQLFSKFFDEKLIDNTMLVFFSDHGFRYGSLRQTHTGEMENRLPFIFIHLPNNLNKEYAENLRQNQFRLTTPFDIHATLTHLAQGKPDHSLPHGLSLFESVISPMRDCNDSSIPEMYCGCYEDIEITDFELLQPRYTIPKIIKKIVSFTETVRQKCAVYKLESIHKLYKRSFSRTDSEYQMGNSMILILQLYLKPGHALFEIVLRGYDNNTRFEVIGEITRINLYGKQAHCLNDKLLNNYCFCKDLLLKI